MKKWIWILLIVILLVFVFCKGEEDQERIGPVALAVEENITDAVNLLKEDRASEGINLLLDIVLISRPENKAPSGFIDHIKSAKQSFQEGNLSEGGRFIHNALLIIDQGRAGKEAKSETEEIAPLAQIMEQKIMEAKEAFIQGDADKGSHLLLESILIIAPY